MVRPAATTPVTRPLLDDGCGLGFVDEFGTGLGGGIHQCCIESAAWPHGAMVGEAVRGGPVEFAHLLAGDHAQAPDVVGVVEWDLQFVQGADGTRGESVTAHLVASVRALLEHHDPGARPSGPNRRRGTCGSGTDHGDVDSFGIHASTLPELRQKSTIEPRPTPVTTTVCVAVLLGCPNEIAPQTCCLARVPG